ncbi:MAG TPA: hypothetical protein DCL61_25895 [Cyanobacteria bacterium UBA12227]|nr:hypothetical protein [Cyanobacteria bacterium UBA12227]HBY75978.1 hypothetical protein [Cyanobacteria bacterium UBA11148]
MIHNLLRVWIAQNAFKACATSSSNYALFSVYQEKDNYQFLLLSLDRNSFFICLPIPNFDATYT